MIPSLGFEVQMTMFEHVKVEEKFTKSSGKTRDAKEKTVHILYNLILHEFWAKMCWKHKTERCQNLKSSSENQNFKFASNFSSFLSFCQVIKI